MRTIRIHYELHIQLYDANSRGTGKLVQHVTSFSNKNYLEARRDAFDFYRSWVDILLQSVGKSFTSHSDACKQLQDFFRDPKGNPDLRTYLEVRCVIDAPFANWRELKLPSINSFPIFYLNGNDNDALFFERIQRYEAPIYKDLFDRKQLVSEIKTLEDINHFLIQLPISFPELRAAYPKK